MTGSTRMQGARIARAARACPGHRAATGRAGT